MATLRVRVCLLFVFLVFAAGIAIPAGSEASLKKPTYSAGDRWVYVLEGSVGSFPGANTSQTAVLRFELIGRVEVDVVGAASLNSGGKSLSAVRVETHGTGSLNGTIPIPTGGSARIAGTFATTATEFWEDGSYLVVQTNATSTYSADVTSIFPFPVTASVRLNSATSISSIPPFDLDVGQNETAALETHLGVNSTFSVAGRMQSFDNQTNTSSTWRRQVLSRENVEVEAGTFSAYKLNQTLGSFLGITAGISGGANETAYFSNETKNYVKRDAYANGTRVAELRLQSYSFGGSPFALDLIDWLLIVAAVAVGSLLILIYWRRRKERHPEGPSRPPPTT